LPAVITVTDPFVSQTRVITYTYDRLNRLTAADYSTGEAFVYAYDAVGNRTSMTDASGTHTYIYDAANRLTSVDGVPYTWDARGNLLHDGTNTYTYDAAGRMVSAVTPQGTVDYTYNAEGLRVSQSLGGVVSEYTWDWATPVVPELLSDGDARYLVGHDTLGWTAGAGWTYALPDALGSVRQEVDASGTLLDAREWTPYGVEVGGAQSGLGYTGE
jgi:YD repeat-containing protein